MDAILKKKDEPTVDEMVAILKTLSEQEKKTVLVMVKSFGMGVAAARKRNWKLISQHRKLT